MSQINQIRLYQLINELTAGGLQVDKAKELAQRLFSTFYILEKTPALVEEILNGMTNRAFEHETLFKFLIKNLKVDTASRTEFLNSLGLNPSNFVINGTNDDFIVNVLMNVFLNRDYDHKTILTNLLNIIRSECEFISTVSQATYYIDHLK